MLIFYFKQRYFLIVGQLFNCGFDFELDILDKYDDLDNKWIG